MGDSDNYSSSEEGRALQNQRAKAAKIVKPTSTPGLDKRKRKSKSTEPFRAEVLRKYKVNLVDEEGKSKHGRRKSKCVLCGTAKDNKAGLWKGHSVKCQGAVHILERNVLREFVGASGEEHRKRLVDTYLLSFHVYKERLPFTTCKRMQKVQYHNPPVLFIFSIVNFYSNLKFLF